MDDNMALRLETRLHGLLQIAFQLHPEADDLFLMPKQTLGFFSDKAFERRGKFKMDARDDQLAMVWSVHICITPSFCCHGASVAPVLLK